MPSGIYSRTKEHIARAVFVRMENHDKTGIYARVKKCEYAVPCDKDALKTCFFRAFCADHCGCKKEVMKRARKREIYAQTAFRRPAPYTA